MVVVVVVAVVVAVVVVVGSGSGSGSGDGSSSGDGICSSVVVVAAILGVVFVLVCCPLVCLNVDDWVGICITTKVAKIAKTNKTHMEMILQSVAIQYVSELFPKKGS